MSADDQWITFDCYGTLVDWQTGFRSILAPLAGDQVEDLVQAFHTFEPEVQRASPTASYRDILKEAVRRSADKIGLPLTAADLSRLPDQWSAIGPFPDTVAALGALKAQGWKLGILTNCDNDLFESTRGSLGVPIDTVVTAEDVGGYKPGLRHFAEFENRTGVQRANWVHAAVSWWHDMVPARDLGLRSVWVDREDSGHDASIVTYRVTSMAALAEVAGDLYRAS